ncbi:thioredoxin family protein [Limnohabitans lacus]|uniref:Thioredoxin family protein n=1 Tax=Limnohabitans lacus TaxID=3045173 RepID=A0ABT6X7Z7_9BURK|nr:thioredoxin family protein [Limnohabitans sp. HM2-2]MDI9234239.1 thioredoxin family protein [Limnohabitans sp. HM2-2]
MSTFKPYLSAIESPSLTEVQALPGLILLEFGTEWCGHCRAAQALVAQALAEQPQWQHLKIEDGPGRALGRSYRIKLWPTLVFLRDGQEVARLVRPASAQAIEIAMSKA